MLNHRRLSIVAPLFTLALTASCKAALLSTLLSGGTLIDGNATYSNFKLLTDNPSPPAANINVTASTAGKASVITFAVVGGAGVWTTPADSSRITFDISFNTPINAIGLDFIATGSAGNVASVGETATYKLNNQNIDNNLQVVTDGLGPLPDSFTMTQSLAQATTALSVIKSIDIASSGGTATITSVSNSYFVPEPASLGILSLAGTALLLRRRKS